MTNRSRIVHSVPRSRGKPLACDVSISRQGDGSIGGTPCFFELQPGGIRDYNHDFIGLMNQVREEINRNQQQGKTGEEVLHLPSARCGAILSDLREAGIGAYVALGEQAMGALDKYEARDTQGKGLKVTVRTDAYPLLWEFVYTGSMREAVNPRLFWGYRHQLARYLMGTDHAVSELDLQGKFLFCRHHQLPHWQHEHHALAQHLAARLEFVALDDYLDVLEAEMMALELDHRVIAACTHGVFNYVHMASHLYAAEADNSVLGARLALSYRTTLVQITLRTLNAARRDWGFQRSPLVFLNACKTMTNPEHLTQGESFPRSFLRLGAGGVVATACDMPDVFAVAFADKFYDILFNHPNGEAEVSDALRLTRQYFMDEYNNPLGLAYGLYAHNDLTVYQE
ncbi:MAG: CHAT domain-containing protein [Anaerolineales bacterium]|nr:CHAT domain-containing protein [Anaerolineales bacterium]